MKRKKSTQPTESFASFVVNVEVIGVLFLLLLDAVAGISAMGGGETFILIVLGVIIGPLLTRILIDGLRQASELKRRQAETQAPKRSR